MVFASSKAGQTIAVLALENQRLAANASGSDCIAGSLGVEFAGQTMVMVVDLAGYLVWALDGSYTTRQSPGVGNRETGRAVD